MSNKHACIHRAHGGNASAAGVVPVSRLGPAQACTLIAFLLVGSGLYLRGTALPDVFALLSGCGALGVGAVLALDGGRRLAAVVGAALHAAADKQ
ncbi:hypothetical protein ACKI16_30955 [Streptomyces scabiei]|uniref:hypothetical protein n=1 Tax=Streptomyces scabiei TaxID=1930 RepID=UPI0038F6BFD6